jgi:hypothetical protein
MCDGRKPGQAQVGSGPGRLEAFFLHYGNPLADAESMCRDEDDVRQIVRQLALTEYAGKRTGTL